MNPLIFLFVSNAAYALNGGHWVLGSDANTSTQILGVSHTGDVASGMPDVDDVVVLRAPEIFDWDAECLELSGQLTYNGAHAHPGWGYYISRWHIDASNIINSEKNDTSAGSSFGPVENNDWSMLGNLTLTNKCDSRKHYDIERNLDVGGNYQAIIVKGSVGAKASCTLSLSSPTVDLGEINASDLLSVSPGTNLKSKDGSVEVTTKCNQSAYTLTFKPEKVAASCIGTEGDVLRFCLKAEDKSLDMTSGSADYPGRQADGPGGIGTHITVTPARGSATPVAGVSSGRVLITVAPE